MRRKSTSLFCIKHSLECLSDLIQEPCVSISLATLYPSNLSPGAAEEPGPIWHYIKAPNVADDI